MPKIDFNNLAEQRFVEKAELYLSDFTEQLPGSLRDHPWSIAPGLVYTLAKYDRSLLEQFLFETKLPSSVCKLYLAPNLLFDIPGSRFSSLSAGRQLYCFTEAKYLEQFVKMCLSLKFVGTKTWGFAVATVKLRAEPVSLKIICPMTGTKAYVPEYPSPFQPIPDIVFTDFPEDF